MRPDGLSRVSRQFAYAPDVNAPAHFCGQHQIETRELTWGRGREFYNRVVLNRVHCELGDAAVYRYSP